MDQRFYKQHTNHFFKGKKVRTLTELRNGYMVIPEGSICEIRFKYNGFDLTGPRCERCGVAVSIGRVSYRDVELV
ncbi:MAG: hypothetical protein ACYTEQ_05760 [Planctomycetota bacterium]|jgi:hypothetical protein